MARLNTFVHVVFQGEDGVQMSGMFGPADDLPDWAAAAITNPNVWDGEPPEPAKEPAASPGELVEPPRHGKGSSAEAWRDYAEKLGWFDKIEADASQRDIIAAVDEERARRAKQNKE